MTLRDGDVSEATVGEVTPRRAYRGGLSFSLPGFRLGDIGRLDAAPLARIYMILLFAIPAPLVLAPLGGAGTPSQMWAMVLLLLWIFAVAAGYLRPLQRTRITTALGIFAMSILASYAAAGARPLLPEEARATDRAVLSLCAWAGISLLVAHGVRTMNRIDPLLRSIAAAGSVVAVVGILQFYGINLVQYIHVPGLSVNGELGQLGARSLFTRAQGTAAHSIEFGAVMSMTLPLTLHFAFYAGDARSRRRWLYAVFATAIAMMMSVSRSAIIGAAIVFVILLPTWPTRRRRHAYWILAVGVVATKFVVPGLIGTIRAMFLGFDSDPSTQGRTADYPAVAALVGHDPLFGRGAGTFLPQLYRTLDNQYLLTAVTGGVLGFLALLWLLGAGIRSAAAVRSRCLDVDSRHLSQALLAAVATPVAMCAMFDMLSFSVCTGLYFLLLGCLGALERLTRDIHEVRTTAIDLVLESDLVRRRRRNLVGTLTAVALVAAALVVAVPAALHSSEYESRGRILLGTEDDTSKPYAAAFSTWTDSQLIEVYLRSDTFRNWLRSQGLATDVSVAVGDGSLMPQTDHDGYGAVVQYAVRSPDQELATRTALVVRAEIAGYLERLQAQAGAPRATWIDLKDSVEPGEAVVLLGSPSRALAGIVTVSAVGLLLVRHLVLQALSLYHRLRDRRRVRARPFLSPA